MKRLFVFFVFAGCLVAAAVNYSYDAAGRLVLVDYGASGSIAYTYDAAGNMTSRVVQPGSAASSAITSANLVRSADGAAVLELRGTNLAGDDTHVTVDGKDARVVSSCNASVDRACRTDVVSVAVPEVAAASRVRIVVTHGGVESPVFWARLR